MNNALHAFDRPISYIGRSVARPNAKRLLAGRGRYITDLVLPRMLHAAFVRSPHAHARIVSIDATRAKALPGVRLAATGDDLAKICKPWVGTLAHFKGMKSPEQWPLALDKAIWAGQAVVAVVADTRAQAEDAIEEIAVAFEELSPVIDIDEARAPESPVIASTMGGNVCFTTKLDTGGIDEIFASAKHVVEGEFLFSTRR
jgi:aerobic carbon-monoxide dehydrogenase large subunit